MSHGISLETKANQFQERDRFQVGRFNTRTCMKLVYQFEPDLVSLKLIWMARQCIMSKFQYEKSWNWFGSSAQWRNIEIPISTSWNWFHHVPCIFRNENSAFGDCFNELGVWNNILVQVTHESEPCVILRLGYKYFHS